MKKQPERGASHPIWSFFIDNYRVTYLIILAVSIFGLISIFEIPKESAPEVNIPVVVIITSWPGSGAASVEELLTRPLENEITGLSEIIDLNSTSRQGVSTITVQFEPSADPNEKMAELRDRVDQAKTDFPSEAGEPSLQRISFSDVPFMNMVLSGPYSMSELKTYAEDLQTELESITNVSKIGVVGAPESQIKVKVKNDSLTRLGLSIDQVINILATADLDTPIGSIETEGGVYALRLAAGIETIEEVASLPITNRQGAVISISEVAEVTDDLGSPANLSRFSLEGNAAQPSVSLRIFKESGQGDILTISDTVNERIAEFLSSSAPPELEITILQNDAEMIRSDLTTLVQSGFFTMMIILSVLTLFLGWREALLASLVVPLSFLITFVVIGEAGLTINFLTLFSLILSLGILVDAAIVVTESIFQERMKGLGAREAVFRTIDNFQAPLVAGALTTVFVFAPIFLVSGVMGEFIKSIPITVSTVLLAALFIALGVETAIVGRWLKNVPVGRDDSFWGLSQKMDRLATHYRRILAVVIKTKKRSYLLLSGMIIALAMTVSFLPLGLVEVNMFPSPDADLIYIDLEAQPGTPMSETLALIEPIENRLLDDPRVESFLSTVGQNSQAGSLDIDQGSSSHLAGLTVNLTDKPREPSQAIVAEYQNRFRGLGGTRVRVTQMEEGPQTDQSIQINLQGRDLGELELGAKLVARELEQIEGTADIQDGINLTGGEFVITVDRLTAERYGVKVIDIANTLRSSIFGRAATELRIANEDIETLVISDLEKSDQGPGSVVAMNPDQLRSLSIQTPQGAMTLDTFIDISLEPGRSAINRQDGDRIISVTAGTRSGYNSTALTQQFKDRLVELELPAGVEVSFGGEAEEIEESFMELGQAMLLGVILIFALLVWQFASFRQPIFILVTIPLALIGVLACLALVGQPLSFPGAIGIVALSGIVVNNAIIIIDTINKRYYLDDQELTEAVMNGARDRLRPVILTTLTTVTGLLPLILVSSTWAPVAYSIIFGLLFSTVLTLLVIPTLYLRFSRRKAKIND